VVLNRGRGWNRRNPPRFGDIQFLDGTSTYSEQLLETIREGLGWSPEIINPHALYGDQADERRKSMDHSNGLRAAVAAPDAG
jgi:hypothetical protein